MSHRRQGTRDSRQACTQPDYTGSHAPRGARSQCHTSDLGTREAERIRRAARKRETLQRKVRDPCTLRHFESYLRARGQREQRGAGARVCARASWLTNSSLHTLYINQHTFHKRDSSNLDHLFLVIFICGASSEHYDVLSRMYLMGSCFEGGALGKVGVRRARQGAGSASTGPDATVRIGDLASWPQRLRTDATVRMVLWMVRGP